MHGRPKEENTRQIVCKVRLNEGENGILDEICKYSGLTKSDAIRRALQYYHDDQCPCQTEKEGILGTSSPSYHKQKGEQPMTINEYQLAALRTANNDLTATEKLTNGLMGLNGEAGECIDILKKHLFQGHDLDRRHIAMELGDVAWYLAVSAHAAGYDLETIMAMNVDKLRARYPDGFDAEHSVNRQTGDI